jgi:DNA-binding transcriptional MerR regulator
MMLHTTREVAASAGVSSRTLRHYETEELLTPHSRNRAGERLYGEAELLRLQQILVLRELGLGLPEIRGVLSGESDVSESIERRIRDLAREQRRIGDQLATLELTLDRIKKGGPLMPEEMFEGFQQDPHAEEAQQRWPNQYAESQRRLRDMSKAEQQALFEAGNQTHRELAALFVAGAAVGDAEVQRLIGQHYSWVVAFWTPNRDAYISLGEMYVADARFTATYDGFAPGLAPFMRDAMRVWAEANLS